MLLDLIPAVAAQLIVLCSILLICAKARQEPVNRAEPTQAANQKEDVSMVQPDEELSKEEPKASRLPSAEVEDSSPIIEIPYYGQLGTRRMKYQSLLAKEKKCSSKRDDDSQRVTFKLAKTPPIRTTATGPLLPTQFKSPRDFDTKLVRY